jgi:acetylornithine/N-succinyldiaminopimelate aminotransferase
MRITVLLLLLCLTAGPGLRLLPPLTITKEEMDKGVAIMKETLSSVN